MTSPPAGLLEQLARMPALEKQPPWLAELRREAGEALHHSGLPAPKHEAWRYTPLRGVIDREFALASGPGESDADSPELSRIILDTAGDTAGATGGATGGNDTWRIALINGVPASSDTALRGAITGAVAGSGSLAEPIPGVSVSSLVMARPGAPNVAVAAGADAGSALQTHLGKLAPLEHFAALNLALFAHVLVVRVHPGACVEAPVHLVHCGVSGAEPAASYPRVLVIAEPGSRLHLIESFVAAGGAAHLCSPVTEIAVARAARVIHTRIHHGASNGYLLGCAAVSQKRDSSYQSQVVSLGGALTRLDLHVALDEPGAECTLDGAYHVGDGEHVAHYTTIDHNAPSCTSAESYRGVVDGTGHAVFDGTITVRRDARATSARQENRNLLLSDDAVINTKPHLRIDADEVSCSHGATVGSLDRDQIFYLRTRGLSESMARALLTYAFVREIIDTIPHPFVAQRAATAMRARLPNSLELDTGELGSTAGRIRSYNDERKAN